MRDLSRLLSSAVLMAAAPALAGEDVLYQPRAAWVERAELPAATNGPPILLLDDQRRIEEGRLSSYTDQAFRIDDAQMLDAVGTVQAEWMPDKGDLIVHDVAIVRGGQVIDLLQQGAKFDVLRREQELESRVLTGLRTATLTVPGLRVGDVLRVSYTTTVSDQALDREVQTTAALVAKPLEAGFARVQMSWPAGSDVRWSASSGVTLPEPVVRDGFATIEVSLPLAEPEEMPQDAPARYHLPALLQAGTFADWQEVSRSMAPFFDTPTQVPSLDDEIARLKASSPDPRARAVAALRLVQDQVSYLANGMAGGNYIPQAASKTWENRYGDCKAKTLLLLMLLRAMDIEAEAVLVDTTRGDALPTLLPMPGDFDHVIVRATIGGEQYWLDGTAAGASLATLEEVPPFSYGLPLRKEGSALLPMPPRTASDFTSVARIEFDHRAGLDIPALYRAEWTMSGSATGPIRGAIAQASETQKKDFVAELMKRFVGESQVYDTKLSFDPERNVAVVEASGLITPPWRWERGQALRTLDLPSTNFNFRPDRSRRAWRDLPVAIPGPIAAKTELTLLLPSAAQPFKVEGKADFDETVAGVHLTRSTRSDGDRVVVTDAIRAAGGELDPAQVAEARASAARLGSLNLGLRSPAGVERRYQFANGTDRTRLAPIEATYARLIADNPGHSENYMNRSSFRAGTFDFAGAIEDLSTVIELEPSSTAFWRRATLYMENGQAQAALEDAERAAELDPSLDAAIYHARLLDLAGQVEAAKSLLESRDANGDERRALQMQLSELEASAGNKEEGLRMLDQLMEERPGDPTLLNSRCWYKATWNYETADLAETCTKAVEQASFSAAALDSRAMAYYRLGRHEDALKDLNAALAANPDLTPSLLLRGIVRRDMGDAAGVGDIRQALARQPSLKAQYSRYGIRID